MPGIQIGRVASIVFFNPSPRPKREYAIYKCPKCKQCFKYDKDEELIEYKGIDPWKNEN
jgi:hypothetical protein